MKLPFVILPVLLWASYSEATPSVFSRLAHRLSRRQTKWSTDYSSIFTRRQTQAKTFSSNVAGAILTVDPNMANHGAFTFVQGNFTIPTLRFPTGGDTSKTHSASAWVGIDGGAACPSAIFQTGVDFTVDSSNKTTYAG
jgi:hypothetical protein